MGTLRANARASIEPLARLAAAVGLTPNRITVAGLLLNCAVGVTIAAGYPAWGGALLILASTLDVLDGAVARVSDGASAFGAFLDSTLDRYSEATVYLGVVYWLLQSGQMTGALLANVAIVGSLMVSYARARAEGLGYRCEVGLLPRPERILILAVGLLLYQLVLLPALVFLAVLTNVTAVQRIRHVWLAATREAKDGRWTGQPPREE